MEICTVYIIALEVICTVYIIALEVICTVYIIALEVICCINQLLSKQNMCLLQTLYSFIVNDLKRLNLKHRNNKVNKVSGGHLVPHRLCVYIRTYIHTVLPIHVSLVRQELQNFMFTMVKDSSPVAAKMSLVSGQDYTCV